MKSERLATWTQAAEILSSVAIVVSLIYVGLEIAQNTKEVRASNRQSTAGRVLDFALTVATNSDLALMLSNTYPIDLASLPPDKRSQLTNYMVAFFINAEEAYHQYTEGLLDEEIT